jgi:hypothetical protein
MYSIYIMNKESIKRILIAVAIAVGLLVVLKFVGSRTNLLGGGVMENMANVNATSNDQRTGVDATAGSGTTVVDTMQGSSNTATIGGTKQSLYAASSDPGVQAIRSQGCFPKDQLTPNELLPQDNSTAWAQVNPQGAGTLKDKNFLQAAHHVGINTVGQTHRNPNLQLRSEPPNPQTKVSPWLQSTIDPDVNRKPLEIGGCA